MTLPVPKYHAAQVTPRLYQGPKPPPGKYDVDVIVLMAEEYQPKSENFPGVSQVVHAPILDNPWGVTSSEYDAIMGAKKIVVDALRRGETVLVTCNAGLNRSGVVVGLAIRELFPQSSPDDVIKMIRGARGPFALSNAHFVKIVRSS